MTTVSLTPNEKKTIENVLTQRREEGKLISKITPVNEKKKDKKVDDQTLILGVNRLFIFKANGKLDLDHHYLDIVEIQSPNSNEITIKFKNNNQVKFISTVTDNILKALYTAFVTTFPAITIGKALVFSVLPETRLVTIFASASNLSKESGPCGSFAITYKSICDYLGIAPLSSVVWDIENLYPFNTIKEFNFNEIYQYNPSDIKALIMSLAYNNYFTSLIASNCKLSTDETNQLTETLKVNTTLQKILLNNIQSSKESIMSVLGALTDNKAIKLQHINVGNNILESKGVVALGSTIQSFATGITHINVENVQTSGKPMESLFNSILASSSVSTLQFLSINNNKLELAGTQALCKLLTKSSALHTLQMSNTSPVFNQLRNGCPSLKTLDFSGNRPSSNKEGALDLLGFFKQNSSLTSINLSRTQLSGDDLKVLFSPATSLLKCPNVDLSDNELGDAGILKLCEVMYPNSNLRHLAIDNNFNKTRSKQRNRAIEALINLIEDNVGIESLSIASASKGLKTDLVPFILSLLKNQSLIKLDVSGNGIGDSGALAITKVLWKNNTLKSLKLDGNDFSASAIKMIKQSVKRNPKSVTLLQLPIVDINAILLADKSTVGQDKLNKTLVEIQNMIHSNVVHQVNTSERTSVDLSSSTGSLSSSGSGSPIRNSQTGTVNGNHSSTGNPSVVPVRKFTSPSHPTSSGISKPPGVVTKTGSIESMSAKRPAIRGPLYPGRQTAPAATDLANGANKSSGATPDIPPIVARSIDFLIAKGTKVVGIFRTCASATLLKKVKARFEAGEDVDLAGEGIDPDTVAGVLKSYFRELATPIFPDNLHERFFQASRLATLDDKIGGYRDVIEQLPPLENKMVKKLFYLLHLISLEKAENMMSAENIAICWAPTLFRSFASELLPINAFLMSYYYEIFDPANAPAKPAAQEVDQSVDANGITDNNSSSDTHSTISSKSGSALGLNDGSPKSTPPSSPKIGDGMSTLRGKRFSRVSRVSYSPVMSRASLGHSTLGWSESSRSLSSLFQDEWDAENNNNNSPPRNIEPQTA